MKKLLLNILEKYLQIYPEENERQLKFIEYLNNEKDNQITDWNNFKGHIVAGGFVYAKEEKKFLVLYHKDLEMYLYPGGHMDSNDKDPLDAAKREVFEETGLNKINEVKLNDNELIPIDIDTQMIKYNERLNLPAHYHFDFRYLFTIDKIEDIKIDVDEHENYKWIDTIELSNNPRYGRIALKIKSLLLKNK